MNEDPLSQFRDILLRRDLTPEEEQRVAEWLVRHPEAAADWRADLSLGRGIRHLAPAPVPSNFTARVLAEVRRDIPARTPATSGWLARLQSRWLPAGAIAAITLTAAGVAWQIRESRQRQESADAQQVSALRALATLSPSVLEDFDAIQRFEGSGSAVDLELLAALQ